MARSVSADAGAPPPSNRCPSSGSCESSMPVQSPGLAAAVTIILLAGQAWAEGSTDPASAGPAVAAEVCAPGAMTITKEGPVVYDGVDCELGPHAKAADAPDVPSATVLRPMHPPSAPAPPSAAAVWTPNAAFALVIALFGVLVALLQLARRRQRLLFASGLE